jgi:hypothetical protein
MMSKANLNRISGNKASISGCAAIVHILKMWLELRVSRFAEGTRQRRSIYDNQWRVRTVGAADRRESASYRKVAFSAVGDRTS